MLFFAYKYQDEYYRTPDKLTKQRNIDMEENWPIAKNIYTILIYKICGVSAATVNRILARLVLESTLVISCIKDYWGYRE